MLMHDDEPTGSYVRPQLMTDTEQQHLMQISVPADELQGSHVHKHLYPRKKAAFVK